jgi:hypothetical protein
VSQDLALPAPPPAIRPQVGLMLSIGEPPTEGRNYPKKLDHFRPKPGSEGQYAEAVARFHDKYGDTPKTLDIILLSNSIGDVLDIRYKAWGTSGLKAVGDTNFAEHPDRLASHDPGQDWLTAFPEKEAGTRRGEIEGINDENAIKLGLKLYGVLRFALEGVTGLTTLAEISTTSRRSMLNLVAGINQVLLLTGGQMAGIPFELAVRPARTRYFDEGKKKRSTTTFYELVFQAPGAIDEFFAKAGERRQQMNAGRPIELPPFQQYDPERDSELLAIEAASDALPIPEDTDVALRSEPAAEGPSEAQLNRIAVLEARYQGDLTTLLLGAYNVQSATELTGSQAVQYESALTRLLEPDTAKVVDEPEPPAGEDGQFSFASMVPQSAKATHDH